MTASGFSTCHPSREVLIHLLAVNGILYAQPMKSACGPGHDQVTFGFKLRMALNRLGRVLRVTLEVVVPPLGVGAFLWRTAWTDELALMAVRVMALVVVVGLAASVRAESREEGSLIRRYAIVIPQALIAAWAWEYVVSSMVIGTHAAEIEQDVIENWPDFPLWSDPTWGGGTDMIVIEWMREGMRLVFLFPILWWTRRYATARQASAWLWSSIAWAGCLLPAIAVYYWNFAGDAARSNELWSRGLVLGWGIIVGAIYVVVGSAVSFALGRNPFALVTGAIKIDRS